MSFKSSLKQLTGYINFSTGIRLNNKKFSIPVIKNTGLLNRALDNNDWFLRFLKSVSLKADSNFIDIGVNVGQTLLKFRSVYQNPYWGFEPNPSCVFYLSHLISANHFSQVSILPIGLSSDDTIAQFYLKNETDSAGTIVNELRPGYYNSHDVTYVPLFRFDKLKLGIKGQISLIKIDVEGAELEVLSGMPETLKQHKPIIVCEVLDSHTEDNIPNMQGRADKLLHFLHNLQYTVYRILHTNDNIVFEPISEIKIRKWTLNSWNLNDYMFVPSGMDIQQLKG